MARYFALHKPYGVLSQFSDEDGRPELGNSISLPKGVYPVGRLDLHSEGLLLLTSDSTVNAALLLPERKHKCVYLVQVAGQITKQALRQMEQGVEISLKSGSYTTLPAKAKKKNGGAQPALEGKSDQSDETGTDREQKSASP